MLISPVFCFVPLNVTKLKRNLHPKPGKASPLWVHGSTPVAPEPCWKSGALKALNLLKISWKLVTSRGGGELCMGGTGDNNPPGPHSPWLRVAAQPLARGISE